MENNKKKSLKSSPIQKKYKRPAWIPASIVQEEELCPDCFKVVGERSRYKLVCLLGSLPQGETITNLTRRMSISQPTITHHIKTLTSVNAVHINKIGREKYITLNRDAHCFEDCKIPFN